VAGRKIWALLACLFIVGAGLASCAPSRAGNRLIGVWRATLLPDRVLEFKPDGTVVGSPLENRRDPPAGKYELLDGERKLKLILPDEEGFAETSTWALEFSEDGTKFRLANERGVRIPLTFEKIK
jgi:hypothetical protein